MIGKRLPDLHCRVVPLLAQRYETAGDYFQDCSWPSAPWQFRISAMGNPDHEFLVFVHELVEWYLTQRRGVEEPVIVAFDQAFTSEGAEPGDDPRAPYHREHVFAGKIERLLAEEIGIEWEEYDRAVSRLFEEESE